MAEERIELEVFASPTIDDVTFMSDVEISQWTNDRQFSILMVAAEAGNVEVVNYLIGRGTNVNCEVNNETPASLAFTNNHHGIVLALLKANSLIPRNYTRDDASDELKAFIDASEKIHARIRGENEENVEEIITQNPSVRHFYDSKNNSALRTAIVCAMFVMIEVLIKNNIFLAPHEDLDDILNHMTRRQRQQLRDLFLKFSPHIFTDTMMTLMRNCHFGPDGKNNPDYMSFACKAFHVLLENPLTAIILDIVAATRDFTIVFDFNREWLDFVDPTTEPYTTNGICYLSGKIYIAAKNMLVPERAIEIISVMVHELCHYALYLVYSNMAKPYRDSDKRSEENFTGISEVCELQKDEEEIVGLVYDCYADESQHAELAVRTPQMITFYHDKPELVARRLAFPSLFNDYEHRVIPEMQRALPGIKDRFRPKHEKKIKNFKILTCVLILCLVLSGFIGFWFFKPTYSWAGLRDNQKMTVKNATLTYRGAEVKLGELFADNSTFYDSLLSDHIQYALKGDKFKLTEAVKSFYDCFVLLTWSNMTQTLRDKFLTSNVNFQGEFVELGGILSHHDALNSLNTSTIRDFFDSKFEISSSVEIKSKFFIERSFVEEDSKLESSTSRYEDEVNVKKSEVKNSQKIFEEVQTRKIFLLSDKAGEGKSTTFRNFALKLKHEHPSKWVQFLDLKKYDKAFAEAKKLTFDDLHDLKEFFSSKLLNLNDFESQIFLGLFESSNVVFLYDGVDEISPNYNDLILNLMEKVKKFTENLQFVSTRPQHSVAIQERLQVKAHKFLPLNEAERWNLFVKFVMISNPEFEESCEIEFFNFSQSTSCSHSLKIKKIVERSKKIINSIENLPEEFCKSTKALDFNRGIENISSDPALKDEALKKEAIHKFMRENSGSIISFFNCHDSYSKSIQNLIRKIFGNEYLSSFDLKFDRFVVNPLLIEMIGEFVSESEVDFDFYSVYEDFIMKKIKIVHYKGEIAQNEHNKFTLYSLNVMQAHQAYAIKLIEKNFRSQSGEFSYDLSELSIMNSTSKFSNDEISRFGLLHVTSQDDFEFAHRTFAEYFSAQYIIEGMNNFHDLNEKERTFILEFLKLNLLEINLFGEAFGVINQFIMGYLEKNAELSDFWKGIKEIPLKIKRMKNVTDDFDLWGFFIDAEFSFLLKDQNDDFDIKLIGNQLSIEEFTEKFDKIKEIFGSEIFHHALTLKDKNGRTLLHVASRFDSFKAFLIKLNGTLSQSEWKTLIIAVNKYGVTVFDYALSYQKPQVVEILKQIIRENLSPSDQEKLAKISEFKITN